MPRPFCRAIADDHCRAQANADTFGARYVSFFDASGGYRVERYDPTCAAHNAPGVSHFYPGQGPTMRPWLRRDD
jgi:hypothetical protein